MDTPSVTIPLTQGYEARVDPEDADLAQLRWSVLLGRYAMRRLPRPSDKKTKRSALLMHRVILERKLGRLIQPGMVVDHLNGDGLDNRRENLREATISLNALNRRRLTRPIPAKPPVISYRIDERDPNVALIPLNQGKYALIDVIDVDLARFTWALNLGRYAHRCEENNGKGKHYSMHRVILERKVGRPIAQGMVVDHINRNGLDNRRDNLREATQAENLRNLGRHSDNTSGYKGVKRITAHTWEARVNGQGIGYYDTAEEAAFAYDKAALEQYGKFASLNHPLEEVLAWVPPVRQFGRKSASGYRGVQAYGRRWGAEIKFQKKRYNLGFFDTAEEAAFAYDKAALEVYGEKAQLNHPIEQVRQHLAAQGKRTLAPRRAI